MTTSHERRVLLVEDEPVNVMLLRELLKEECDVLAVADTGEAALDMVDAFHPHLVLLDVMLPGIDGHAVCRELRRRPALDGLQVIMLSALAHPDDRRAGIEAGADDYLIKPLDFAAIREGVRASLAPGALAG